MRIGDLVMVSPHISINSVVLTKECPGVVASKAKNFQGCLGFYDVVLINGAKIYTGTNNLKKVVDNRKLV